MMLAEIDVIPKNDLGRLGVLNSRLIKRYVALQPALIDAIRLLGKWKVAHRVPVSTYALAISTVYTLIVSKYE